MSQLNMTFYQRQLSKTILIQSIISRENISSADIFDLIETLNVTKDMVKLCSQENIVDCILSENDKKGYDEFVRIIKVIESTSLSDNQIAILSKPYLLMLIHNDEMSFIEALQEISYHNLNNNQLENFNNLVINSSNGNLNLQQLLNQAQENKIGFFEMIVNFCKSIIAVFFGEKTLQEGENIVENSAINLEDGHEVGMNNNPLHQSNNPPNDE